jgi:hypothetical protein
LGKLIPKNQVEVPGFFASTGTHMERGKRFNDAVSFLVHGLVIERVMRLRELIEQQKH